MYIISACLCGVNCKYSGENNLNEKCAELFRKGKAILVCPEQLGGLSTPRTPVELKNSAQDILEGHGIAITKDGLDVTNQFVKGAYETLKIAKEVNVTKAILKEKSPSCGVNKVYDGSFQGNKIDGMGLTAYLLQKEGIEVFSEEDIEPNNEKLIYLNEYFENKLKRKKFLNLEEDDFDYDESLDLTECLDEFSDLPSRVKDNVKRLIISLAEDLMGFTEVDEISEATGLTIEEITSIKNEYEQP
ncbi:DUF523 domain-containing protein [Clostridium botulinum]|uniref:DUF523 domain-containing protein n=1 Tax=unclassified Clostridium TaxID=2614128 RepID=UPI0013EEBBD7|nr:MULTISPECIES: DUF523 domain-containing protein [unclassified Clostridium]MBN1039139.1 DUF523 domain-containing protein [Clostridium botulinum]MBN1068420.1 DUF523 domain-containing protein [Clostridium botulinum]MBZ9692128.1 DUF523 domain-containing protein [Clostridium sp. M14]NFG41860.1 DUF523 domain-containing protein [Clostridium botulinum]NFR87247.1 DUF523 domain-containing protein [Clostridium botulinum]